MRAAGAGSSGGRGMESEENEAVRASELAQVLSECESELALSGTICFLN